MRRRRKHNNRLSTRASTNELIATPPPGVALKVDYESRWIFNVGYTACWFGLWMMRDTALFD